MALARSCLLLTTLCSITPSLGPGMRSCFQRRGLAVGLIYSLDLVKSIASPFFYIPLVILWAVLGSPVSPTCGLMTSLTWVCNVCSVGPKGWGIYEASSALALMMHAPGVEGGSTRVKWWMVCNSLTGVGCRLIPLVQVQVRLAIPRLQ